MTRFNTKPNSDFYQYATQLPLLQGLSAEDIWQLQDRGALRLVSVEPEEGDVLMRGGRCNTLTMLMSGTMLCITEHENYRLEEEIQAPAIIEEEAMWSISQAYNHSYRALTEGKLVVINRENVNQIMVRNEVFRFNLLTRMATRIERYHLASRECECNNIGEKILKFFREISYTQSVPKHLSIKMTTLASIIGETRLNVSRALHQLERNGIISIGRGHITLLKMQ
jgi:CRP-like cAMP-binding protein